MEPTPETEDALIELETYGDVGLRGELRELVNQAQHVLPELMGVSLGLTVEDLVLTYVASDLDVGLLDAMPYLDAGPRVSAVDTEDVIETTADGLFDEQRWQLFAQGSAAYGVRSSLSLPFLRQGVVTGGANFYGSGPASFRGHVEQLAELFGAWAPGAIHNADLAFRTRQQATLSVGNLREARLVDQAVGVLVAEGVSDPNEAETRLREAATRAGIPLAVLARAVVHTHSNAGDGSEPDPGT
ncbi:ANTAR domain-containing protein [Terrabacter sp. 2RAF25]|uniref:ANTAR domain-containing protein n=1 Tax=Terrabacter sp. 2RAF25 TaxID=3232998 RepID=UPI003F9E9439